MIKITNAKFRQAAATAALVLTTAILNAGTDIIDGGNGKIKAYQVDPFSATPILPTYDVEKARDGRLDAVMAKGTTDALSFVLKSTAPVNALTITPSPLTAEDGAKLDAEMIDIKVVKLLYMGGSSWHLPEPDETGMKLTPKFLMHNEGFIYADFETKENRLNAQVDGKELYPFALESGKAKQLIVKVTIPETAKAGIYKSSLTLSDGNGKIELTVRVLDYKLPPPKARYSDSPFYAIMIEGREVTELLTTGKPSVKPTVYREKAATQHQLQANRTIMTPTIDATAPYIGVINPAVWRLKKGAKPFLDGYDGIYVTTKTIPTKEHTPDSQKLLTSFYLKTINGKLESLSSLAVDAALTDVAYLSYLNTLARGLYDRYYNDPPNTRKAVEGRRAMAFLADIHSREIIPATLRLETIAWIERLLAFTEEK